MATYDPPQPLWKRNLVGMLDFLLAFCVCVCLVSILFHDRFDMPEVFGDSNAYISLNGVSFKVTGGSALLAVALIVVYFIVLGLTGGTVFQRLFGMKRVTFWRRRTTRLEA